jgi:hypothetical protein
MTSTFMTDNPKETALAADESCRVCTEVSHPFGGPANTGSPLNIRVHLRLTAFSRIIP